MNLTLLQLVVVAPFITTGPPRAYESSSIQSVNVVFTSIKEPVPFCTVKDGVALKVAVITEPAVVDLIFVKELAEQTKVVPEPRTIADVPAKLICLVSPDSPIETAVNVSVPPEQVINGEVIAADTSPFSESTE